MPDPVYNFLDYSVVTGRRQIFRDGQPVLAEPKVYDLIVYLLERRERAVSKEELQEAIWPNVIVTESALTRCVMKARQTVGDDAKQQKVIGTVSRSGYRFAAPVTISTPRSFGQAEVQRGRSRTPVAVLPFANLSDSADHDYLARGLTLDIATDLSRNAWLFVVSPGSLQQYQSLDTDYQKLADDFDVQYVIEGSLRRVAAKLRINAALVDATSGAREWSERYDQPVADLFEIQDDIVRQIVTSLGSQVRRAEGRRSVQADKSALDVWGLLHRGMAISWSRFNRESNQEAEAVYRQALEIEPENARTLAFLANSIAMKVSNGWSDNIAADTYQAWLMGRKAVNLLPDDPMVLSSFGHLNTCLGKAADAVEILTRSIELDPNSAWSMGLLAFALTCCNRADEAIVQLTNAIHLSPRDAATHWYLVMLAWAYLNQAHYDDAALEAQRSINTFAGWSVPWATLAVARAGLGQMDAAREALAVCRKLDPAATRDGYAKFFAYVVRDASGRQSIRNWLDELWPEAGSSHEDLGSLRTRS